MKNTKITLIWIGKIWMYLCTFIVTASVLFSIGIEIYDPSFWNIDSCLDRGGAWDEENNRCYYSEEELQTLQNQ